MAMSNSNEKKVLTRRCYLTSSMLGNSLTDDRVVVNNKPAAAKLWLLAAKLHKSLLRANTSSMMLGHHQTGEDDSL